MCIYVSVCMHYINIIHVYTCITGAAIVCVLVVDSIYTHIL